jgi:hypothetical protein
MREERHATCVEDAKVYEILVGNPERENSGNLVVDEWITLKCI